MFSGGMPPATGQNQGATAAQRDEFYALQGEQRGVKLDADGVADEMELKNKDQQDHERLSQQAEVDARQSDTLIDQGKRAVQELKNQVDDGWNSIKRFAESIGDKQKQADLYAQQSAEQLERWFSDWLLISISNTAKNFGEIMVHIFSIMKKMHAAENSLGASVSPLELGAFASVTSAPLDAWHAYLQKTEEVKGEWNKYNDETTRLGEQEGRVAERQEQVNKDSSESKEFWSNAHFEEGLSDDLRAELEGLRQRYSGYREQLSDLQARMDKIRQDVKVDPTQS